MQMDERKRKILLAIVQDYIATAEPVGSRTISKKYDLGASPATIRNEMADLEELGLIEQPHTSAGRVPSDQGYRYYVDYLMERQRVSKEEQRFVSRGYELKAKEIAQVIQRTTGLLSEMSNYTAIVLGPQAGKSAFKHIQLVPVDVGKALLVVVSQSGMVYNKLIETPEGINNEDLQQITRVLNAKLEGLTIQDIKRTLIQDIYFELSKNEHIFQMAMQLLEQDRPLNFGEEKVYLSGTLNMLNQPEFRNLDKVKSLLGLFDQESVLKDIMYNASDKEGLSVTIGGENQIAEINECSMITATYHIDGKVVGALGVLGPTRMEYAKVTSLVDFMTNNLSEILSRHFKK